MLTLVAAVLAYDLALEACDPVSSIVEAAEIPLAARRSSLPSLKEMSWTRLEKDMIAVSQVACAYKKKIVSRIHARKRG
jgi:hypothetical protein